MSLQPGTRVRIGEKDMMITGREGVIVADDDPLILEEWPHFDRATDELTTQWVRLDEPFNEKYYWRPEEIEVLVTEEDVEAALASIQQVYNTPSGEHPDLIRLRERDEAAIAQGYTDGDVNHYVQPIIGRLRLRLRDDKPIDIEDMEYVIDRLVKACNAELAWLDKQGRLR